MQLSKNIIKSIELLDPINFQNLIFHPICFENKNPFIKFKTLDDAFDQEKVVVQEISHSGSVPEVKIVNNSDDYLILIDGEAIKGAKQNRIILSSLIIDHQNEVIVPVNCVEKGRWQYKSDKFQKASFSLSPKIRDTKTEYLKKGYDSQGAVWNEIDQLSEKEQKYSNTSDLGEILERNRTHQVEDFLENISNTRCNGFILQGIETSFIEFFYNREICKQQIFKNVNGWIAEQHQSDDKNLEANFLLNKFLFENFENYKNIGVETSYITCNETNGKAMLYNGSLIHGFYYY